MTKASRFLLLAGFLILICSSWTGSCVIVLNTLPNARECADRSQFGPHDLQLLWSSANDPTPRPFVGGVATDYRITLHASMPEADLTRCSLSIQPQIVCQGVAEPLPDGFNPFIGSYLVLDSRMTWFNLSQAPAGALVTLVAWFDPDYDCDFMAWLLDTPSPDETCPGYFNVLGHDMATEDDYEHGFIRTPYPPQQYLYVACFSKDLRPVDVELRVYYNTRCCGSSTGNSLSCDTYRYGTNMSTDAVFLGYFLEEIIEIVLVHNLTINNFWSPHVTIEGLEQSSETSTELWWSSSDSSPHDVNWYEVSVISEYTDSYEVVGQNITETHFVWNSSGYEIAHYSFRVRAYSVDLTYYGGPFPRVPDDYFPGDYGDAYTGEFSAGDQIAVYRVQLSQLPDIEFAEDSLGNLLNWSLSFEGSTRPPEWVHYDAFDNGSLFRSGTWHQGNSPNVLIPLDALVAGAHNITLTVRCADGITHASDTVWVTVTAQTHTDSTTATRTSQSETGEPLVLYAIDISASSVIALCTILIAKSLLKRKEAPD